MMRALITLFVLQNKYNHEKYINHSSMQSDDETKLTSPWLRPKPF
mgnify:CR=1 FL=1